MSSALSRPETDIRRDLATEEGRGSAKRQSPTGRLVADVEPLLADLAEARAENERRTEQWNRERAKAQAMTNLADRAIDAQRAAEAEYAALKAAVEGLPDLWDDDAAASNATRAVGRLRCAAELRAALAAAVPTTTECSTCEGAEAVRIEGQIGAPGSGGWITCPDCGPIPSEATEAPSTPEATTSEPETMTWRVGMRETTTAQQAELVVLWIKRNDGEAWYEPEARDFAAVAKRDAHGPLIVITGPNGKPIYVKPGDKIVKGSEWFNVPVDTGLDSERECREFTVSSPEATT